MSSFIANVPKPWWASAALAGKIPTADPARSVPSAQPRADRRIGLGFRVAEATAADDFSNIGSVPSVVMRAVE
jgi:hypothetical protein